MLTKSLNPFVYPAICVPCRFEGAEQLRSLCFGVSTLTAESGAPDSVLTGKIVPAIDIQSEMEGI